MNRCGGCGGVKSDVGDVWKMVCGKWCVEGVGDGVGDGWRNAREKDLERTGDCFLKTVGSLPNTTLTGATVDRFETVRNWSFSKETVSGVGEPIAPLQDNIAFFFFPSHETHVLQPLNVGVFAPLDRHCAQEVDDWTATQPLNASLLKGDFLPMCEKARKKGLRLRTSSLHGRNVESIPSTVSG